MAQNVKRFIGGLSLVTLFCTASNTIPHGRNSDDCSEKLDATLTIIAAERGSAFVINVEQGLVLTNNHLLSENQESVVFYRTDDFDEHHEIKSGHTNSITGRVLARDADKDLALIQLNNPRIAQDEISFARQNTLESEDYVYAIGTQRGQAGKITEGQYLGKQGHSHLRSSILLTNGNSGGPLLDANCDLVGLNDAVQLNKEGENIGIGYAIDQKTIRRFLKNNGVQP